MGDRWMVVLSQNEAVGGKLIQRWGAVPAPEPEPAPEEPPPQPGTLPFRASVDTRRACKAVITPPPTPPRFLVTRMQHQSRRRQHPARARRSGSDGRVAEQRPPG